MAQSRADSVGTYGQARRPSDQHPEPPSVFLLPPKGKRDCQRKNWRRHNREQIDPVKQKRIMKKEEMMKEEEEEEKKVMELKNIIDT